MAIDPETGEVVRDPTAAFANRGPLPAEIAQAIVKVMTGAKQLGFDEKNLHGGYDYVSIDKFLAALRPLCASAGLIILLDEVGCEFRAGPETREGRQTSYAFPTYEIWLVHETGASWGPLTRRLALPATGPQTFGTAESYVLKRFLRNLFLVPTGEKDADGVAEGIVPGNGGARMRRPAAPVLATGTGPPRHGGASEPEAAAMEQAEAERQRRALSGALDECRNAQDVDDLLASPEWDEWDRIGARAYPRQHPAVRERMMQKAERIKQRES